MSKMTGVKQTEAAAQRADDLRDDMPKMNSAHLRRRVIRKDVVINNLFNEMWREKNRGEKHQKRRESIYRLIKNWQKSREDWLLIHWNEAKDELRYYPRSNARLYQVIVAHAQELQLLT